MLIEPSAVAYARPLSCGTVEHEDGTITEGCSSEPQNNGIEGSMSEYEAHACCNVGWMAVDLESALDTYTEEQIEVESFCGIDVGTGVYANEEFIVPGTEFFEGGEKDDKIRKLFAMQQDMDYKVKSWETLKGNFKVYNFTRVDDLQLLFANTVVFGTGEIFDFRKFN